MIVAMKIQVKVYHHSPPHQREQKVRIICQFYRIICFLGDKFYYGLRIVTGDQAGASPDTCNVVVSLTGDKGTTGEITINVRKGFLFKTRFEESAYDDLVIECDGDLGDIQVVHAGLRYITVIGIIAPDWYIDYFTVHNYQSTQLKNYPCYHWIGGQSTKDVTATSETGKS